jgi:hypothetical protein
MAKDADPPVPPPLQAPLIVDHDWHPPQGYTDRPTTPPPVVTPFTAEPKPPEPQQEESTEDAATE